MIIRNYKSEDKEFLVSLSSRFTEFDFLRFREPLQMEKKQEEMALEAISKNFSNIFIAETNGEYLGYIEMRGIVDYFTGEKQGYLSAIAVTKKYEGNGVGKKLMKKAEEWTNDKGYKELVLQLFNGNERAMKFYEKLGFEKDITVMIKQLKKQI
ncbi:GNAT family N-acetyltransferase [Virgibacillus pantothenticus]|uniref:GNAT family N-acetyltransferase n=1 Tax=Virgibacillus pantothenticus TaxID=1473 RepID=UPI00147DB317|nr:GNAT family N-acetyltransferase [Virgibacillus pantothenticus]MBU8567680.1 GNAT family N-acetyltransferase [Virgibacillus pantothenticus]MBU8602070.1 GNAT family N-acetyltransferase [Virgibacillus pantothenticus]MBU8635707.1 GNAT family N-acetyltransferase [Virgibacillus pantothenticus]MBU8643914.1 GNAT family N-acetyltransferase [Virgibacillus pantothenticus]MBU8648214.1 GNAT family N-acetyltransferase [Virgibacillus pantothenticus]